MTRASLWKRKQKGFESHRNKEFDCEIVSSRDARSYTHKVSTISLPKHVDMLVWKGEIQEAPAPVKELQVTRSTGWEKEPSQESKVTPSGKDSK